MEQCPVCGNFERHRKDCRVLQERLAALHEVRDLLRVYAIKMPRKDALAFGDAIDALIKREVTP